MKGKKAFWMIVLVVISVISIAFPSVIDASPETRVYVEPPTSVANPGQIVTVTIEVQEVTGLFAWEFFLSWDSEILYTNDTLVTEGDFLNQGVPYPTTFVKDVTLFNMQVSCLLQIPVAVDGSGTLAEIQFEVRGTGQNILELYDTALRDIGGIPIVHTSDSGVFYTTYPRAEFTFSPSPESPPDFRNPVVDEVVTFNASESYDPDGTIVSYDWDFDDGTSDSGEIVTHAYTAPGTYAIILTVTDDEAKTDTYQKSATVELRDIAIVSLESPSAVWPGDTAFIDVTVANEGSIGEYFNLTVHYDDTPIWYNKTIGWKAYTLYDRDEQGNPRDPLGSGKNITITFTWNTTGVAEGTHTIRANASRVNSSGDEFLPLEYDPADNKKNASILFSLAVPTAKFTFTPEHPRVDEDVTFDASESNDMDPGYIVSYTWDFDDGNVTTVYNITDTTYWLITHTYSSVGTYDVTLTVTDNDGLTGTTRRSVAVGFHDIAITSITLSKTSVDVGESLSIDVRVRNKGGFDETFNITAYSDGEVIGTSDNLTLKPGRSWTETFTWSTTGLSIGTYTISANTSVIPHDIAPENNFKTCIDKVTITTHDIAITDVRPSSTSVDVGESLSIDVDITNQGSFNETFNVNLYYDSVLIETRTSVSLSAGDSTTLTFTWNTTDVSEGNYTIKAEVPQVSGETDTADNVFTDGTVTIQAPEQPEQPEQPGIPLYVIAGVAGIAIIIIAAILFYFMKVRKPK